MRVNHITSLGGPILQGLNKRPQINNRKAFEAVMRRSKSPPYGTCPKRWRTKDGATRAATGRRRAS
ncbi:hypothetical protein DIPPA_28276 [Diplonema papillatum]|nr:hypothetical protein DIPPA_28276 [Diplonema papillatum]